MAMSSRILCRASLRSPTVLISHHRHHSNKSNRPHLIEVDTAGVKKLEDLIHNMIIRRAAPDWLPFLPGYSYWAPPRSAVRGHRTAGGFVEAFSHIISSGVIETRRIFSEDQRMSSSSERGWPSSDFFLNGNISLRQIPVEVQMKLQDIEEIANDESNSDNEEG